MDGQSLKRKLRAGEASPGMWLRLSDPTVAELVGQLGFDWVVFDAEHVAYDLQPLQTILMAFNGSPTLPIIRVYTNDPAFIKRILDMGAGGVLIPQLTSAAEAKAAVAACKYPPAGIRGAGPRRASRYGHVPDYFTTADAQTVVFIMLETVGAMSELDEILKLPGLDGLVIGPTDLSMGMGFHGDFNHEPVQAALESICAKAKAAGMPFGTGRPADDQSVWARRGATLLPIGDDELFIHRGAQRALEAFKQGKLGAA
jgi:2-keto-3-deoxy-L-rhamnonate aldolase RhmA